MTPRVTENSASIARHIMIQLAGNNLFQNHLFSRDIIKIATSKNHRAPKLLSFIGYVIDLRMTNSDEHLRLGGSCLSWSTLTVRCRKC